jgi:cytochrome c oxidase subunit 1
MHLTGLAGEPRHYAQLIDIPNAPAARLLARTVPLNKDITYFAIFLAAAQLPFLINLINSYFHGPVAGANPWQSTTLEWCPELHTLQADRPDHLPGERSTGEEKNPSSANGEIASYEAIAVYRAPCEYDGVENSFRPQWSSGRIP